MSIRFDCFKTNVINPRVKLLDIIDSTNTEAKNLFLQGDNEGLIVMARSQTAGRGRMGRTWISPIGGLYFSIILKPPFDKANTPLLGLLSACAVARSLITLGVKNVSLKWPNDVLVRQSKIGGILSEAVSIHDEIVGIVIGIGVNQNCPVSDMPPGLQWPTTSIIDELGKKTSTEALLCSIVNEMDSLLQVVKYDSSFSEVLSEWREKSSTIGARVRIHEVGTTIEGVAKDISSDGSLIVETEDGAMNVILGDVSHIQTEE